MTKFIAYYRVSTQGQGKRGLGLEAQKRTIRDYLTAADSLIAEFTEVESGKNNNRPELEKAIELSQQHDATLIFCQSRQALQKRQFHYAVKRQ